jgi:hypothetical protein
MGLYICTFVIWARDPKLLSATAVGNFLATAVQLYGCCTARHWAHRCPAGNCCAALASKQNVLSIL